MELVTAIGAVLGAIAAATALGLVWRARTGRVRHDDRELAALAAQHGRLGRRATLLQFSTEVCAPCRATSRALRGLSDREPDVAHIEIDLTRRADLAQRLNILQTPTTFVLDRSGRSRARIGGAPRLAELRAVLGTLDPEWSARVRAA